VRGHGLKISGHRRICESVHPKQLGTIRLAGGRFIGSVRSTGLHGPCHSPISPRCPWQGAVALSIRFEAFRQPRRLVGSAVAVRAWRTGRATGAGVRSLPWLIGMRFANQPPPSHSEQVCSRGAAGIVVPVEKLALAAVRKTPGIAARSFERSAKDYGRRRGRTRATRELQSANPTTPAVRRRGAAQRLSGSRLLSENDRAMGCESAGGTAALIG
jgi:hypothetical protein